MADRIDFNVPLPTLAVPHDVATRELSWSFDRGNGPEGQPSVSVPASEEVVAGLFGPQDAAVHFSLVDIDNAGNRSEPRVHDDVLTDSVSPPQPGEFGIVVTGETVDGFPDA